ncbi:hypothetical protein BKA57DRAFT_467390 [Linnemannia elongata]|nr:hypothetical protein BKA57DRAFT_467390 [Linnemannia elongata]
MFLFFYYFFLVGVVSTTRRREDRNVELIKCRSCFFELSSTETYYSVRSTRQSEVDHRRKKMVCYLTFQAT